MPDDRPHQIQVFIERDEAYYKELEKLSKAVVMHTQDYPLLVELDLVVKIAVDTGLVRKEEIAISQLTGSRFLIHLPDGLKVETFINATSPSLWDDGMTFQQWSPHVDATAIVIPTFKILLDLVGFPVLLWRESQIIKAASRFGTYLGTVKPEIAADKSAYKVAVATDDLSRIPLHVVLTAGGIEYKVPVKAVVMEKGAIYTHEEMPQYPPRFCKPTAPQPLEPESEPEVEMEVEPTNHRVTGFEEDRQVNYIKKSSPRDVCRETTRGPNTGDQGGPARPSSNRR